MSERADRIRWQQFLAADGETLANTVAIFRAGGEELVAHGVTIADAVRRLLPEGELPETVEALYLDATGDPRLAWWERDVRRIADDHLVYDQPAHRFFFSARSAKVAFRAFDMLRLRCDEVRWWDAAKASARTCRRDAAW